MNTRTLLIAIVLLGFCTIAVAADRPKTLADRPSMGFAQAQQAFQAPGMAYAPFMFWFWDEPLDPAKMAEMSRVMLSQGFNPGYAHARRSMVGTPDLPDDQWLTDKWFTAFGAALKEAKAKNGYLGFCDEYWWPSLQAHGRLVKEHPELAAQSLDWKVIDAAGGSTVDVPASYFVTAAQLVSAPTVTAVRPPDMGKWIWDPNGKEAPKENCWMRKVFHIPAGKKAAQATIRIAADNEYKLYLNGKMIGSGKDWMAPGDYDVTREIASDRNVLAVVGHNIDGASGMIFGMRVALDDGSVVNVASDASWKTTLETQPKDWAGQLSKDSTWNAAREIAGVNEGPWAGHDLTGEHFVHRTIRSNTLQIIGAGQPFAWKVPEGYWRVYVFNKYSHTGTDGGVSNPIDERTGQVFRQIALEPYAKQMAGSLGNAVPGDFIDNEGDYGWSLAWSDSLDTRYKERYGRDIRLWMPMMLDRDTDGLYAKARWDWFDLVSDLYSGNFRTVTDWNEQHGMSTTAHFWEGSISAQVNSVGDHMKILRALSMPGQDCLGKSALYVHDFKEIESVAEFGNTRAATEFAGAGGWEAYTPEFLKQGANAITAWGMSHVIPHGVFTTRKLTGNKWMADWYSESPMFPWMHLWNEFVSRASFINSCGHASPDVLLYNPLESGWALCSADMLDSGGWEFSDNAADGRMIGDINGAYSRAIQDLTDGRVEFLVGDRKYVSEMTASNGQLARGPLVFKTVVLPPLTIMPLGVASKIVDFAKQGGRVYSLGSLPAGSSDNGMNDPEMAKLMKELAGLPTFARCSNLKPLIAQAAPGLESPVKFVSGAFPMLQQHRRIDGRDFYWLVNNSEKDSRSCEMLIANAHGAASIWDCETGQARPVASRDQADGSRITLIFKPLEAYWLVFDPKQPVSTTKGGETASVAATVDGPWTVTYDASIQPVLENQTKPGADFQNGIARSLDDWSAWGLKGFSGLLDYDTTVTLQATGGEMILDLGNVQSAAEVWVNDKPCGMRLWGPYEFDITSAAKAGPNRVRVRIANLINNSYGDAQPSGLMGPVRVMKTQR